MFLWLTDVESDDNKLNGFYKYLWTEACSRETKEGRPVVLLVGRDYHHKLIDNAQRYTLVNRARLFCFDQVASVRIPEDGEHLLDVLVDAGVRVGGGIIEFVKGTKTIKVFGQSKNYGPDTWRSKTVEALQKRFPEWKIEEGDTTTTM